MSNVTQSNIALFRPRLPHEKQGVLNTPISCTRGSSAGLTLLPYTSTGPRVWNSQLLRFCGTRNPDGTVLGDPAELDFTEMIQDHFGWEPPKERTQFDLLPLVVQVCSHFRLVAICVLDTRFIYRRLCGSSRPGIKMICLVCSSTRTRRHRCLRYRTRTARLYRCTIPSTSGSRTWASSGTASPPSAVSRYPRHPPTSLVHTHPTHPPPPTHTGDSWRAALHGSAVQWMVLVYGDREKYD